LRRFVLSLLFASVVSQGVRAQEDAGGLRWNLIDRLHWQVVASAAPEPTAETDAREGTRGACAPGMVDVQGEYRLAPDGSDNDDSMERLQNKTCVDWWIQEPFPPRCRRFDDAQWKTTARALPTKHLGFCIDRFEYPNIRGENPYVLATYPESEAICKKQGKRLCTESEWTFACEGPEALPYPTGTLRSETGCVLDREWIAFNPAALGERNSARARSEISRLWQGAPSGSNADCKSVFGVYDMTGNVDEWTHGVRSPKGKSILKGGFWGPVRGRCRPSTRSHDEQFAAYQQGFRCCGARGLAPDGGTLDAGTSVVETSSALAAVANKSATRADDSATLAHEDAGMLAAIDLAEPVAKPNEPPASAQGWSSFQLLFVLCVCVATLVALRKAERT
jgi:formylglycine-generating enzyme